MLPVYDGQQSNGVLHDPVPSLLSGAVKKHKCKYYSRVIHKKYQVLCGTGLNTISDSIWHNNFTWRGSSSISGIDPGSLFAVPWHLSENLKG